MISQNSQQAKLDYLFSELTSVKSHVQLKQQILLPPESQDLGRGNNPVQQTKN